MERNQLFESEQPIADSSIIVGAGLAGLATAIKIKRLDPGHSVAVVDKPVQESNTIVSGQRFRAGITGKRQNSAEELLELLVSRNEGVEMPEMRIFADTAERELEYWQSYPNFVHSVDKPEWFGPQLGIANSRGNGRGRSVLDWFSKEASRLGVEFIQGDVDKISSDNNRVDGLSTKIQGLSRQLHAKNYIIAAGNIGGYIFNSTNKPIVNSGQQLLFEAGATLTDTNLHMLHPFGRANSRGESVVGCFETDSLEGATVFLDGLSPKPVYDQETSELLRAHEAHYHFPELAERFHKFGSIIKLVFPDGQHQLATVAHHYAHVGVDTVDGVRLRSFKNAFVAGDSAGIGYWTNHNERYPGFALTKTLVDAALISEAIVSDNQYEQAPQTSQYSASPERPDQDRRENKNIRRANSHFLLEYMLGAKSNIDRENISQEWVEHLESLKVDSPQVDLSLYVARSHGQIKSDIKVVEKM